MALEKRLHRIGCQRGKLLSYEDKTVTTEASHSLSPASTNPEDASATQGHDLTVRAACKIESDGSNAIHFQVLEMQSNSDYVRNAHSDMFPSLHKSLMYV